MATSPGDPLAPRRQAGRTRAIDPELVALPLADISGAGLEAAQQAGAAHAEVRVERSRDADVRVRDHELEGASEQTSLGLSVRVLVDGTWGFAATTECTTAAAARAAAEAAEVARLSAPLRRERIELAPEPVYPDVTWVSSYEVDPLAVPTEQRTAQLMAWTERLLGQPGVAHADATVLAVSEAKYYADLAGTTTTQQRVRVYPWVTAVSVDPDSGEFDTMQTLAPPAGRGWEYLTGTGWDWDAELDQLPDLLAEKVAAPTVEAGTYDLVIDPTNLWLTIHESIGHATELDRALGYEAAFAGTSFATVDQLGTLVYGSPVMHVTGDRTVEHGLATAGWDDEGVEAQSWDLIRDGILVGYQLDRRIAARQGYDRSNGCAFADSSGHVPLQRMANVCLQPAPGGPSTNQLISAAGDGIYVVGDRSWSIDMQRYNFQFTGQRFYRIKGGRLAGQLRDVAYQGTTTEFWGSMEAVGGESTYLLGGTFNCGKGQPDQAAPVSHGCPSALFRGVRILNANEEAGR
jgi:TldD protein